MPKGTQAPPAQPKPDPIDNTELVAQFREQGGQVIHVRPSASSFVNWDKPSRGMTVAFVPKNGRVEVATSVTHRSDSFTKKIGTKKAIERFQEGKTVSLPAVGKGRELVQNLQYAFAALC